MNMRSTTERYGSLSIGLHWLMLLLLIAVYACIELREIYPKGSDPREALKAWHFMLGLSVFVLVWVRIFARISAASPQIIPAPAAWQSLSAKLMHLALYVLMIAMPILGWLLLSAAGKPIPFFGLELPALVSKNKNLAALIKQIHETGGSVGYFLVGFHAVAALFHHYVVRDNTLLRMLPKRK
ncbi:MAG: cytochrome b [Methylotenera sp.]|uniref:cytochrome b n=1 Tax=Methylotenera sp. TaxID=2051956 RepID=UPI002730A54E|nr:cytochrome b [Methylotenera sp.]MDP1521609.1 cytochrome b [Methylotenera sp.]